MSATSIFATSKRAACDRCRKQKLRCDKRQSTAQSCGRCTRAGVHCSTGDKRPLGLRIPTTNNNKMAHETASASPGMYGFQDSDSPSSSSSSSSAHCVSSIASLESPISSPSSSPLAILANAVIPVGINGGGPLWVDDIPPPSFFDQVGSPTQACHESLGCKNFDYDAHDFLDRYSEGAAPYMDTSEAACLSTNQDDEDQHCEKAETWLHPQDVQCVFRLSQLHFDLCRQIERRRNGYSDATTSLSEEDRPGAQERDFTNDLADTLYKTEELLGIIQCLSNCCCSGTRIARSRLGTMAPPSQQDEAAPLSLVCVLNLVSCYLDIVHVFNSLIVAFYRQVSTWDTDSSSTEMGPRLAFPELHLAGFPVQQCSLQSKILVVTIKHQFEMMEEILGLPAELCVTRHKHVYTDGLLRNVCQDVFSRPGLDKMGKECHALQEHIDELQHLLNM